MDREIGKLKFVMHNENYHRPVTFPLYISNTGYSGGFRLKLPIKQLAIEIRDVYDEDAYFLNFRSLHSLSFKWDTHDLIRSVLNNRKRVQDVAFGLGTNTSKNIYSVDSNKLKQINDWLNDFTEHKKTYIYRIADDNYSSINTIGSIELKLEDYDEQKLMNIATSMVL